MAADRDGELYFARLYAPAATQFYHQSVPKRQEAGRILEPSFEKAGERVTATSTCKGQNRPGQSRPEQARAGQSRLGKGNDSRGEAASCGSV
ncbi:hypothetical protein K0M31_002574 [Melipona bicolor]|uniref:Uncharacterized protein n=1 Tax=Melipona bicolor TaxID=60889 RepID=A0AA40GHX5_9HYME|nr:hypothetical protein K0M31_002574 [Melipona bicolor]